MLSIMQAVLCALDSFNIIQRLCCCLPVTVVTTVTSAAAAAADVQTSIQTLRPKVSGYLNLWSKNFPGPGFSGGVPPNWFSIPSR